MKELTSNVKMSEEDTQKGRFLLFSIDGELYGIEINHVTEIIGFQSITKIPELPVYIKGIINLRGKIIPLMDVSLRFNKGQKEYNDRTCVIVVELRELCIGLIVDCVTEVSVISEENIVEPPVVNKEFNNRFVKSIGKHEDRVVLLLDCDNLILEQTGYDSRSD